MFKLSGPRYIQRLKWPIFAQFSSMFLNRRDPLSNHTTLDIVFIVAVAVLVTLLCTVGILHCILRRRQRRDAESTPRVITLHIISGSESYSHKKDNDVVAPTSKYTSFAPESGYPNFSDSGIEKASENDISLNRSGTISFPIALHLPPQQHWQPIHVYRVA
ncbi:hypothetical protein BYT27DRAFT_7237534 [Phlegmacium glaucopus]|nr:hypothetical protein BYT27DRAFT_7237534 [Phlegmacium glaucopus]